MLDWVCCQFSGGHEYAVSCEPGAVYLRCTHCGKRSSGWNLRAVPALPDVQPRIASVTPGLRTLTGGLPLAPSRALR
jgi:hypothetical protein